jgi:predicted DNA-binding protein
MLMPEADTIKRETTSIKVDPEKWKDIKIEAIKQGKTVSDLVMEAIDAYIRDRKKK